MPELYENNLNIILSAYPNDSRQKNYQQIEKEYKIFCFLSELPEPCFLKDGKNNNLSVLEL